MIATAILLLALAGCGASTSDSGKNASATIASTLEKTDKMTGKPAVTPTPTATATPLTAVERGQLKRDVRDARPIVESRLQTVADAEQRGGTRKYGFTVQLTNLDHISWEWTEAELIDNMDRSNGDRVDRLEYSVDPTAIGSVRLATYQGYPAVRFDCATGKCIRVRGQRMKPATGGGMQLVDVNERRAYNVWPMDSKDDALRVVDALQTIVESAKAL